MKTLLILLVATVATQAAFEPRRPVTAAGVWECAIVKITPRDNDRNPAYKAMVSVSYNDAGRLASIDVIWTRADGSTVDRSEQYTRNVQLNMYASGAVSWFGRIGDRKGNWTVEGKLNLRERTYTENFSSGTFVETRCHPLEGE